MKKIITKSIMVCLMLVTMLTMSMSNVLAADKSAADTLQTNGNGGKTDVGIWYVTYLNESMFPDNWGKGEPIMYRPLISLGNDGILGTADDVYGIPDSSDPDQIDMHLQLLSDAKIDFIMFDMTNGGLTSKVTYGAGNVWIANNATLVCQRIAEWNKTHDWKIKYAFAVGTYAAINTDASGIVRPDGETLELQAEAVYKNYFLNEEYGGDNYYQLDGKPLLIAHDWGENDALKWESYFGDRTYGDKFTVRAGSSGEPGTYGWVAEYGVIAPQDEVELIMPGWGVTKPVHSREDGQLYQSGWETILSNDLPRIVMITAFNDVHEKSLVMPCDTSECKPTVEEQWVDEDGNIDPTMYWDMTVKYIRQMRIQNGEKFDDGNGTLTLPMVIIIVSIVTVLMAGIVAIVLLLSGTKMKSAKKGDKNHESKN